MDKPDYVAFGTKLRQMRKNAGLYQDELVARLNELHLKKQTNTPLRLDGNRISKWERAYQDKGGRVWKPRRQQLLLLIELFIDQLTRDSAREWAELAGYQLTDQELDRVFARSIDLSTIYSTPAPNRQLSLQRLEIAAGQHLFGVDREQHQLRQVLERTDAPWIIGVDGIGGIGKTSLVNVVVREILTTDRFYDVAWISAKQEEFQPGLGLQAVDRPILDVNTFTDKLLEQLAPDVPLVLSTEEKQLILTDLLKKNPYLVVVDNLETIADNETVLALLHGLVNPSKFVLTSRRSLHGHPGVFCLSLNELSQADTLDLLRYEAEQRGLRPIADAAPAQLVRIYQVTGGNPLALKLVIGQLCVLPLAQVLDGLKEARGKKVDELYTYIYWQAWHELEPSSRQILSIMPLAQGGDLDQIKALCDLEPVELDKAIERLITLSLVEITGDIDQRHYRIHRLTETFLLNEVVKWQSEL